MDRYDVTVAETPNRYLETSVDPAVCGRDLNPVWLVYSERKLMQG